MKRALVLEPQTLPLDQLASWGEVLELFPAGCVPAHHHLFAELLLDRLEEIGYDFENDAIAVVGKASKLARTCAIVCSNWEQPVFLYWHDAKMKYVAITEAIQC